MARHLFHELSDAQIKDHQMRHSRPTAIERELREMSAAKLDWFRAANLELRRRGAQLIPWSAYEFEEWWDDIDREIVDEFYGY